MKNPVLLSKIHKQSIAQSNLFNHYVQCSYKLMRWGGVSQSSQAGEKYILANDLVVKFGNITALNSFSTQIPKGIVGLLGPNGAGKTTFIKAMLGHVRADRGNMLIDGIDPSLNMTAVRDIVGYMPENDCLINEMNAVELVSYMGQLSGMTATDAIQRTHEVLDFISIGEERYRPTSSYSTGMKQKVKLAQAIVHDPKILFFDEPTNGMDPQGREEMLDLIRKIGKSGKSIIVSSHVLNEVEKVCEYVIIMNAGIVIKEGLIKILMKGEKDRYLVKVRGNPQQLEIFQKKLAQRSSIVSAENEGGQVSVVFKGAGAGRDVFGLAAEEKVEIRYYGPETLVLEDVFLKAFEQGGAIGY